MRAEVGNLKITEVRRRKAAGQLRLDIKDTNVAVVTGSAVSAAGLKDGPRLHLEVPAEPTVRADPKRD